MTIHLRSENEKKTTRKNIYRRGGFAKSLGDIFSALLYQYTDKNKNRTGCQNSCGQDMQY